MKEAFEDLKILKEIEGILPERGRVFRNGRKAQEQRIRLLVTLRSPERLKSLRGGDRRGGGYQIKMEDPIYDTVADDEYDALVSKRREEFRGFIVDDDGLGGMVDKESMVNGIEAKVELGVKEGGFTLNATIKEEKNPALSATAGWQAVRNAGNGSIGLDGGEMNPALNSEEKPDFELDSDGSLPFYILDVHEEFYGANAGNVYLFGKDPPLPSDLKGELFSALLGTHNSALELFLVKRKIKGPSWLSISKFSNCPAQRVSWCKFEVVVDCPKDIQISSSSKNSAVIPPVVVTAINLKTIISEKQNVNEIVSASIICCHKAKVPSNMWSKIGRLKRSAMPKLTKGSKSLGLVLVPGLCPALPGGFYATHFCLLVSYSLTHLAKTQLKKDRKEIAPHDIRLMFQSSESLMDLVEHCGYGASRVNFVLSKQEYHDSISVTLLIKWSDDNIKSSHLLSLIECSETDAWLSVELMFHLSILPLTRQLTNISGNLWGKTLQVNIHNLVHVTYFPTFVVSTWNASQLDSLTSWDLVSIQKRDKMEWNMHPHKYPTDSLNFQVEQAIPYETPSFILQVASLSIEGATEEISYGLQVTKVHLRSMPVFNLVDKACIICFVLKKEYNICFTTVHRPANGSVPRLPSSKKTGVLPEGASSDTSTGIAQRARHPDELKRDNGKWMVDIAYYLSQQIHPVVSRLCASIQGTSPARLADCLGLDSSKFQSKSSDGVDNDASSLLLCGVNDDERYGGCEPLTLSCPSCCGTFECPTVLSSIRALISDKKTDSKAEESSQSFWHNLHCPKCPDEGDVGRISPALIANQVKRQTEGFISTYYKGLMTCDDETCKYTTRSLNLRVLGDSERGTVCPNYPCCNGHLIRKYTEADLYKQLTYFCHVLDTVRCIEKIEHNIRIPAEKELARIRPLVDLAASTAQRMRDRCAFGWVQLKDLIVTI
ncbi:hypothetical protein C3L33_18427, partial [Rhododendron williamsianum]